MSYRQEAHRGTGATVAAHCPACNGYLRRDAGRLVCVNGRCGRATRSATQQRDLPADRYVVWDAVARAIASQQALEGAA